VDSIGATVLYGGDPTILKIGLWDEKKMKIITYKWNI